MRQCRPSYCADNNPAFVPMSCARGMPTRAQLKSNMKTVEHPNTRTYQEDLVQPVDNDTSISVNQLAQGSLVTFARSKVVSSISTIEHPALAATPHMAQASPGFNMQVLTTGPRSFSPQALSKQSQ